jgi:hypothetical protein
LAFWQPDGFSLWRRNPINHFFKYLPLKGGWGWG